jgi:hypothetical protein
VIGKTKALSTRISHHPQKRKKEEGSFSYKFDRLLLTPHSFSVTLFTLAFAFFRLFLQKRKKSETKNAGDAKFACCSA